MINWSLRYAATSREEAIEKIRKVRNLAAQPGTQGEGDAAHHFVKKLMDRHGITEEDLAGGAQSGFGDFHMPWCDADLGEPCSCESDGTDAPRGERRQDDGSTALSDHEQTSGLVNSVSNFLTEIGTHPNRIDSVAKSLLKSHVDEHPACPSCHNRGRHAR